MDLQEFPGCACSFLGFLFNLRRAADDIVDFEAVVGAGCFVHQEEKKISWLGVMVCSIVRSRRDDFVARYSVGR